MSTVDAFIAANRFGLGAKCIGLDGIADEPRTWLLSQLETADGAIAHLSGMPDSQSVLAEYIKIRRNRQARMKFRKEKAGPLYRREATQRTIAAVKTNTPFRERLVQFWSNHFTVSTTKGQIRPIVAAFEREAIRPHVTGRFTDMLLAATKHPAMLIYLDNYRSIGPNSRAGLRRGRGLNENLARELLELHTLGVGGGYTQKDVISLAKILTGWSVGNMRRGKIGAFAYFDRRHEPGTKILLGHKFYENGTSEGEAALRMLASHSSTAKFIAIKLARHFIADIPPPSAVKVLKTRFLDTDGDLKEMSKALVMLTDAWQQPLTKIKTPNDLLISAFRLVGLPQSSRRIIGPLRLLGQMPFAAPSPAGWADTADAWISPESLMRRIELMELLAKRVANRLDARALADIAFAPIASQKTISAISRAESRREALSLVLTSSEFQRR